MKTKITISSELAFLIANAVMGLGVAMLAAADLGMSMTGAPAYLLSIRFPFLSFGMWELAVQLLLIFLTFLVAGKVQLRLFLSLASGSVYAVFLDLWRAVIPILNPQITTAGMLSLTERGLLFCGGIILVVASVAVFFHCYIYPQSYDLFVRELCKHSGLGKTPVKTVFDCSFLVISIVLSLVFFGQFRGIGIGTVLMALCGGTMLGLFDALLCRFVIFWPSFPKIVPLFQE